MAFGFENFREERTPHLLFTVRSQEVESHKGQISFLGGVIDPGEEAEAAALREAREELGLNPHDIQVIGRLPELPTLTTGFRITPVVGVLKRDMSQIEFHPHPPEVEQAFWVPLDELLKPKSRKMETYRSGEVNYPTPVFYWEGKRIWGATAVMIWNLLERIDVVKLSSDLGI